MAGTETAGAPGVNDDNWSNLAGTLDAGGPIGLVDNDGTAVEDAAAGYARLGNGILNDGGGIDDGHMFSSSIDAFDYPAFELSVAGVPYARYDVYAYHQGGAPSGLRRVAQFTIGEQSLFALRPEDFAYRQSTSTTDQGGSTASDGFRRNRFCGIQVVGVEQVP